MKSYTWLLVFLLTELAAAAQPASLPQKIDSLRQAVETAGDDTTKARSLCRLCWEFRVAGDVEAAREAGNSGLALAQSAGDKTGEMKCRNALATLLKDAGDLDAALAQYEKSLEINVETKDKKGQFAVLANIGAVYAAQSRYARAFRYYQKSLKISRRLNDLNGTAITLTQLGNLLYRQGAYDRALENYLKGLALAVKTGDRSLAANVTGNIGGVYYSRKEYDRALEFFQKAADAYRKLGEKGGVSWSLGNIGTICLHQGKDDEALKYYLQGLEIDQAIDNQYGIALAEGNLGSLHNKLGERGRATLHFERALEIYQKMGDRRGIATAMSNLAQVKNLSGQPEEGRRLAARALEIATEIGSLEWMRDAAKFRARADSALGDYKSAFLHHKLFQQYHDSLKNEAQSREIGRLEAQYDFDKEIEAREKQEAAAAEQRVIYIWAAAAGFAALLLISGLLAWGFRTKQKANKQLAAQNAEIKLKSAEIKLKNEEILQQSEELSAQNEVISLQNKGLDTALAELRELSQFKESMTGMIVHDLKNPLSVALGRAELTGDAQLKSAALQMHNLTMNMLDVQKFESAGVNLELRPAPARQIAASALEQVAFLAEEKNIALHNEADPNLYILADETYMIRVLVNLLNNAVKFTPYGGQIRVSAAETVDGFAELAVTDSGAGIPEDKLDAVFDKFSKLEDKSGQNKQGTGLGLTFCKLAAEAHGGAIRAENAPEGGARFRLALPRADAPAGSLPLKTGEPEPTSALPELTAADKAALAPVLAEIRQYEIYEMSEIVAALAAIEEEAAPGVQAWRRRLEGALYALDEQTFAAVLREAEADG